MRFFIIYDNLCALINSFHNVNLSDTRFWCNKYIWEKNLKNYLFIKLRPLFLYHYYYLTSNWRKKKIFYLLFLFRLSQYLGRYVDDVNFTLWLHRTVVYPLMVTFLLPFVFVFLIYFSSISLYIFKFHRYICLSTYI